MFRHVFIYHFIYYIGALLRRSPGSGSHQVVHSCRRYKWTSSAPSSQSHEPDETAVKHILISNPIPANSFSPSCTEPRRSSRAHGLCYNMCVIGSYFILPWQMNSVHRLTILLLFAVCKGEREIYGLIIKLKGDCRNFPSAVLASSVSSYHPLSLFVVTCAVTILNLCSK